MSLPTPATVLWFLGFWVVLPAWAHAENGWPGVVLLLALYAAGVVVCRAVFGRGAVS